MAIKSLVENLARIRHDGCKSRTREKWKIPSHLSHSPQRLLHHEGNLSQITIYKNNVNHTALSAQLSTLWRFREGSPCTPFSWRHHLVFSSYYLQNFRIFPSICRDLFRNVSRPKIRQSQATFLWKTNVSISQGARSSGAAWDWQFLDKVIM